MTIPVHPCQALVTGHEVVIPLDGILDKTEDTVHPVKIEAVRTVVFESNNSE